MANKKRNLSPKTVLKLPDLEQSKTANSLPGTIFHPVLVCHSQTSPLFSPAIIRAAPPHRSPWRKVCSNKPAVGQTNDRIQADRIGCNRTSNPGQRRRLRPSIQFENFDRFPIAMMNYIERMDSFRSRAQI
jgi:hypothetical protein